MRRIPVDRARAKQALNRGGDLKRVDLDEVELASPMPKDELLALDEALDWLATVDTCSTEIVKLCFFVGLTQEAAARDSAREPHFQFPPRRGSSASGAEGERPELLGDGEVRS